MLTYFLEGEFTQPPRYTYFRDVYLSSEALTYNQKIYTVRNGFYQIHIMTLTVDGIKTFPGSCMLKNLITTKLINKVVRSNVIH
jgi:hypothetical protein